MSDSKQPESMRPIPDGGLKDSMPSWLKRPPAWRELPSAEQRHERTLPDPDTSEIDPHSLVEVADLPKWLQSIAARGEIAAPQADPSTDHAVEVVRQVHLHQTPPAEVSPEESAPVSEPTTITEPEVAQPEANSVAAASSQPPPMVAEQGGSPIWMGPLVFLIFMALAIGLYFLL